MEAVLLYSFKVALCLGALYLFYFLALRQLTFYNWNRWFLLLGLLVCCVIPALATLAWFDHSPTPYGPVIKIIPRLYTFATPGSTETANPDFYSDLLNFWLPLLFFTGILVQGSRLAMQFWSFYRLHQHAQRLPGYAEKVYQVDQNLAPFSFGQSIFLNSKLLQPAELPEIIRHELVHIRQKHTCDVLWLEFLLLFQWYNPFVYLLKRATRQNLEFIADRSVISNPAADKKNYQYLLVKLVDLPALPITQPFTVSPLKIRIKMMNKMPSAKRELAKFFLVFPVMAVLLLACQEDSPVARQNVLPTPVLESTLPGSKLSKIDYSWDDFYQANVKIKSITPSFENNKVVWAEIELKSGNRERYNLKNETAAKLFQKRYGKLPQVTLPPPPPVITPASAEQIALQKRQPQIEIVGKEGEYTMVVFLNSGKKETYDLNNPASKALAEKKYGKLPKSSQTK